MNNLRVLRQVYDDYDAERAMHYDKLSRVLNNTDLTHDPVSTVRNFIEQIAHIEHAQEVTVEFMKQIQEDLAKVNQLEETKTDEHSFEEDDGMNEEDGK